MFKDCEFTFDSEKNEVLKRERGISFEEIITLIESDGVLAVVEHHNSEKYKNQSICIVDVGGYVFLVPFVKNDNEVFLKTIYPSRKATKKYLTEGK